MENKIYMSKLENLWFKLDTSYNKNGDGLNNYLNELENRIYTVGGKVLTDKDRIKLELLRISKIENLDTSYKETLEEIKKIMTLNNWDNPITINYIKELLLSLQIDLKSNITFLSVVDSLYNKEKFKASNMKDLNYKELKKSELVKRG